jgi:hypothetical protein
VAIDDIVETSGEFADSRALPGIGTFTHLGWAVLPKQCIINVGMCAPHPGSVGAGGGIQAEYVAGPPIQFTQAPDKYWHHRRGLA